jgi:Tannase and feruloyl esterase
MSKSTAFLLILLGACAVSTASGQAGVDAKQACAQLEKLGLVQAEIVGASAVEPGALDLKQEHPDPVFKKLPAFCRVIAVSRPSADSNIKIEVWLPLSGWNGKFLGQGNGGFAGEIGYEGLAAAVLSGFASGGTDTGHTGNGTDATWALGHPEKIIDFGNRGVHLMTELSKLVVQAFYAKTPEKNYFTSCSDGGREALMEAQRYPGDYDGILAGAPAYNWTSLLSHAAQVTQRLVSQPADYLPASKIPAIDKAVLKACGNGEPGPFLSDPRSCHFSPDTLVCKGAESASCLTKAQADSLKTLYADANLPDGKLVYHGLLPGGEAGGNGWQSWITGDAPDKSAYSAFSEGYFSNMVYSDPHWDVKSFDLARDLKAAWEKTGQPLDAINPDLRTFKARGGKLILYHGWNDAAISPLATIDYYNNVVQTVGQVEAASFVRLFMVPGMQHCGDGPGLADFGQWGPTFNPVLDDAAHSITTALETWVETGTAPQQVIGRGGFEAGGKKVSFSQPICAYPKAAEYKGSGNRKSASSYTCVAK